jgi:hypothetical protein
VRELCELAQDFVAPTFGVEAAGAIDRNLVHPWETDPLAKGSYSSVTVGKVSARTKLAAPLDDDAQRTARRVPDEPEGCGEHLRAPRRRDRLKMSI